MSDAQFRACQHAGLQAPHIKPITDLVDELSEGGSAYMPYVSPSYGGVESELLMIFQDPGPKTQSGASGMLCAENDDPTAELLSECLAAAGLEVGRIISWNAYPWYINKSPSASQLDAGLVPLRRLLALLERVQVVMLMGRRAEESWTRLARAFPALAARYTVIASLHPSARGITRGGQTSRAAGVLHLRADLSRARGLLA